MGSDPSIHTGTILKRQWPAIWTPPHTLGTRTAWTTFDTACLAVSIRSDTLPAMAHTGVLPGICTLSPDEATTTPCQRCPREVASPSPTSLDTQATETRYTPNRQYLIPVTHVVGI